MKEPRSTRSPAFRPTSAMEQHSYAVLEALTALAKIGMTSIAYEGRANWKVFVGKRIFPGVTMHGAIFNAYAETCRKEAT